MRLEELGEFGLIRRIAARVGESGTGGVGIGDDCAVLTGEGPIATLVTTDMLIENVDFVRAQISPEQLGRKSLAVNLSDIAAMGGMPRSCFLSLGLPSDVSIEWVDAFIEGLIALTRQWECPLLGGDTTRSPAGVVINVCVLGEAARDRIKFRTGARAGDVLAVTGMLGDSGAGLRLLLDNKPLDSDDARQLLRAHHDPSPHLLEGQWLAGHRTVHAMMDVSDGLDSDVRRIMERADVQGALIELEHLPVSDALQRVCDLHGWSATELAVAGGEDYCLLCAIAADSFATIAEQFARRFGRALHRVGALTPSGGLIYQRHGQPVEISRRGFDHFARA